MAWLKHRNGLRKLPVSRQIKSIKLAREIGSTKPAFISQGWGPQRHANGEIATRAISMLAILTGNVGINGGNSGRARRFIQLTVCPYADSRKPDSDQHFHVYVDRCH
ncbi:anaerobic dimethyl sulfoxide reductase chain A [Escherichia coli]|uniref:Anaerobic dimethyl sulfoxide reductase chain A n=1 Tax=Escherichia coli TaxID=562 RepID=A0A377KAN5_ECOLX|nr:anaerobic dimethyl sulfoxide reductase chain A [Escherichia coli]